MEINSYSFGKIVINGKCYYKDLIVFPEKVLPGWQRIKGHLLSPEDLEKIINYKPEILIIGTGESGAMRVPDTTKNKLKNLNIELIAADTKKACVLFNEYIQNNTKTSGAFHLTC